MQYQCLLLLCLLNTLAIAQKPFIQYLRPNDSRGLNVFESPKDDTVSYNGIRVRIGGDFTMQFQGLNQENADDSLADLGANFNRPTANLNIDVQLLDGLSMHLRTYLSSRHHPDTWIKGGHININKLDFVKSGFLDKMMQYSSISVGLDEINYGDAHFRRSDNARTMYNPFVGNYLMDAFTTEVYGEVTLQNKGLFAVLGLSNGKLDQSVIVNDNTDNKVSFYGKLGYDINLSEDLRIRLSGSWYINNGTTNGNLLYSGDRTGSRYYEVLHTIPDIEGNVKGTDFDGRFDGGFDKMVALQVNPFVKYKGLEFFGIYELSNGSNVVQQRTEGSFTQIAAELLYRFGKEEKLYLGARYNIVSGRAFEEDTNELKISRINAGAGWFISKNILTKIEYVNQEYKGDAWQGRFSGAKFSGVNIEAAISF